jgi:hypothetical protein
VKGSSVPPIKVQQPGKAPEIASAEIQIPDDADLGTGSFSTSFKRGASWTTKSFMSVMMNPPAFQITATTNPNREVPVLLGRADGSDPMSRVVFILPASIDESAPHVLRVDFSRWRIVSASFDGAPLTTQVTPPRG